MTFGIHQSLRITICDDADDAIRKGYKYTYGEVKPIEIKEVVIVRDGTVEHNSTADLILEDENGQRYVVMITGRLLKSLPL